MMRGNQLAVPSHRSPSVLLADFRLIGAAREAIIQPEIAPELHGMCVVVLDTRWKHLSESGCTAGCVPSKASKWSRAFAARKCLRCLCTREASHRHARALNLHDKLWQDGVCGKHSYRRAFLPPSNGTAASAVPCVTSAQHQRSISGR